MKKHLLFACLCVALIGAGCTSAPAPAPTPTPEPMVMPTPEPTPTPLNPGTPFPAPITVSMKAVNFAFQPATITAQPGQGVTITFASVDGTHNFSLPALGISQNISSGSTISFNAPTKAGSYEFHCAIGSHAAMGMTGTLIVK